MEDNRQATKFFYWFFGSLFIFVFINLFFKGHYEYLIILLLTGLLTIIVLFGLTIFNLIVLTPILWLLSLMSDKLDSKNVSKSHEELKEEENNNE